MLELIAKIALYIALIIAFVWFFTRAGADGPKIGDKK